MKRLISAILLFPLLVGLLPGCSKQQAIKKQVDRQKELEERFRKVAYQFGNFITVGDFRSAYAMTSSHFKSRKSYSEFAEDAAVPLAEGAKVASVEYETMPYEVVESLANTFMETCPGVPEDQRQAVIWIKVKIDADSDGNPDEEISGSAFVISESGQDRICEFLWEQEEKPEPRVIQTG